MITDFVIRHAHSHKAKDSQEIVQAFKSTFSLGESLRNASADDQHSSRFFTYRSVKGLILLQLMA